MAGITLAIAALLSCLTFIVRPKWYLFIYFSALAWYPSYLAVNLGTVDFTLCRIIILAVYAALFMRTDLPKRFKLIWLDKFVIIFFLCQLIAGITTMPIMKILENRAGCFFDLALPYFAVRMIVTDKDMYLRLLKGLMVIAGPLALFGAYESMTGHNVFGFLRQHAAWGTIEEIIELRHGFRRATTIFTVPISFGLFFAMLGPMCVGLFHNMRGNRSVYIIGIVLMLIGLFSSMSSGPLLSALLSIMFLACFWYRKYWKALLLIIIMMCLLVEIVSNRHFYEVIDRFTYSANTAWYRVRVINVALFEGGMSGHWIMGYGLNELNWGPKIDGRQISDIVNHYIVILCRFGLVGLIPFLVMVVAAARKLVVALRSSSRPADLWLVWCLASSVFGILGAAFSVMLMAQARTIFYVMLGLCGNIPQIVVRANLQANYYTKSQYQNRMALSRLI